MKATLSASLVVLWAFCTPVLAVGPEHVEGFSDAGSFPGDAQLTTGSGTLGKISGSLGGLASGLLGGIDDLEDMYVILIKDPEAFSATTVMDFGGSAAFDSRLYLFAMSGNGLLGNDDTFVPLLGEGYFSSGSTLGNAATDQTGVEITEPGLYLLAITVTPREPLSDEGPIFFFKSDSEVSGPDGEGGGEPIIAWEEDTPPTGACCVDGETCIEMTEEDCLEAEGQYFGDGTGCDPNPCFGLGGPQGGDYEILLNGVSFATDAAIGASLVIKQGACPAPVNPNSNGVIPMVLVGEEEFDVSSVDVNTLALRRCDGAGGVAMPLPNHIKVKDLNHPNGGSTQCEQCNCGSNQSSDGIDDLELKFRTSTTLEALGLSVADGVASVELTGLLADGTPFAASNCLVVVPPGSGPINLAAQSNAGDTFLAVTPLDLNIDSDGFTDFGRSYISGTTVTLTAPLTSQGRSFLRWSVNGDLQRIGLRSIQVTVASDTVVRAFYDRPNRWLPADPARSSGLDD